ncbi:MAG TPA: Uma2 family endonuclease [Roseiflexaceae bacterium]|nr:Uma2 family endonuclease [Roseiflexaceae bacterium]
MAVETSAPLLRMIWPDDMAELDLAPLQGLWTVEQYLKLTNQTNQLIEFTDGVIEVLPMPTKYHQAISKILFLALLAVVQSIDGDVFYAPLRVQVRSRKFREPDLLLVLDKNDPRAQDEYWLGADLVMEIVSPDRPQRDTEEKPRDYAEAGIPEYWIVNPLDETITLLILRGDAYTVHGVYRRGERVASLILDGFSVNVGQVFDAR